MLFWIIVILAVLVFIGMLFNGGEFDDSEPFGKDGELFYLDDMDDPDGPGQCM